MIKEYYDSNEFINENKSFLDLNLYMSSFFYLDAPLYDPESSYDYMVKVSNNDKWLLAMKVSHYNLMIYGDESLVEELFSYLDYKNYKYEAILSSIEIGNEVIRIKPIYTQEIGMDFMEAKDYTEETSKDIVTLNENDVDELYELLVKFIKDCGLNDPIIKEKIYPRIHLYRAIKENGHIISFAQLSKYTDTSYKIAFVYTKDEYRGKGYARKVVNSVKNEILDMGFTATLNVDKKNPISNHLYESLGFKKVFSQGVYIPKIKEV